MKSLKSISVFVFSLFLGLSNVKAQDATPTTTDTAPTTEVTTEVTVEADSHGAALTADQVTLLKAQKDLIIANREAFKASLTEAQLAILENTDLSKKDIFAALAATFTTEQRAIITANKESVRALRDEFRSTLTSEQRQQLGSLNNAKARDVEAIIEFKGRANKRN